MDKAIEVLADAMTTAYMTKKTQGEAVKYIKAAYRNADINILCAMWSAIDAYVKINP